MELKNMSFGFPLTAAPLLLDVLSEWVLLAFVVGPDETPGRLP